MPCRACRQEGRATYLSICTSMLRGWVGGRGEGGGTGRDGLGSIVGGLHARPGGASPSPIRVKKKNGRSALACVFAVPRCMVCNAYTVTVPAGTATRTLGSAASLCSSVKAASYLREKLPTKTVRAGGREQGADRRASGRGGLWSCAGALLAAGHHLQTALVCGGINEGNLDRGRERGARDHIGRHVAVKLLCCRARRGHHEAALEQCDLIGTQHLTQERAELSRHLDERLLGLGDGERLVHAVRLVSSDLRVVARVLAVLRRAHALEQRLGCLRAKKRREAHGAIAPPPLARGRGIGERVRLGGAQLGDGCGGRASHCDVEGLRPLVVAQGAAIHTTRGARRAAAKGHVRRRAGRGGIDG